MNNNRPPAKRRWTALVTAVVMLYTLLSPALVQAADSMSPPSSLPAPSSVQPEPSSLPAEESGGSSLPESSSVSDSSLPESAPQLYLVRFLDYEGNLVGEAQSVERGGAALAPDTAPAPEGEVFSGWSTNAYLNVQSDLDIQAVYGAEAADLPVPIAPAGYHTIRVWAEDLIVSDTSKEYGSPDPTPILLGMPSNLVAGVDYHVEFERDPGEDITNVGHAVRAVNFYFIKPGYSLQGNESAMKEGRLYIIPRKITLTANSASRIYDGTPLTNSGFTVGGSGLAPGNTATVAVTGSQIGAGSSANTVGAVTIKNASNVDVTGSYTITKVNGTLTVTKAPLTIKADNKILSYGAPVPAFTFTYTGFVNGETSAVLSTQPTGATTYTVGSSQGLYPITVSGAAAANYTISYQQGTINVLANGDQITVIAASGSKVYDGTPLVKNTYTVLGLPGGFTLHATVSGTVTGVADSGTGNNVVTSYVIKNGSNEDVTANFSNIVKVAGNLSITPATLFAKMEDLTMEYGAAKPASFPVTYSGFVNGETSAVLTAQTTAACSYSLGDAPGLYEITGTGAAADNYAITYIPGNLNVNRISAPVTVTANSKSKVYDGTPLADDGCTVTGLPGGYSLTAQVTGSATQVADSVAGNNVVSNVVIKNSSNQDVTSYFAQVSLVQGTLSILPAPLTIEMKDVTLQYTDPIPVYDAVYHGFVNGETKAVLQTMPTASCSYTSASDPGAYPITGADATAANYTISYLPGILTVQANASQITVVADSASKVYDGAPLTKDSITYTNLPAGYTLTATVTGSVTHVAEGGVGNNVLSNIVIKNGASQDVTANFTNVVAVPGNLTILPAPLVAEMTDYVIEFNDPAPAYEVTYTGFVGGENESVLLTPTVAACSYAPGDTANSFAITGSGATAADYTISYLPGVLTVRENSDQITVYAKYASKVYDGIPLTQNGFIVMGLPPGYTLNAMVSGSATTVANSTPGNNVVGDIVITETISGDDVTSEFVNIVKVNGDLVITPAPLVIQVDNKTTRFSEDAPAFTATYLGLIGTDPETVVSGLALASGYVTGDAAGSYAITGSGAAAANYSITYQPGTLTVHKYDESITLVAGYGSKVYDGTPLIKNTYTTIGSLPAGYTSHVVVSGAATQVADSMDGNNVITSFAIRNSDDEDVTGNFSNIATVNGTLTITPAPLLAHMDSQQVQFSQDPPAYTVSYTGFAGGEDESVLTSPTTPSCAYAAGDVAGSYPITGAGAAAANYTITYIEGNLQVVPLAAAVHIVADSASKVYDGAPLTKNTFTVSGALPPNYTVEAVVSGTATHVADSLPGNNEVDSYVIKNASNVDVTSNFASVLTTKGTLSITPAPLVVEMDDFVIAYNDPVPVYPITYHGFVNGEDAITALTQPVMPLCSYAQGSLPGQYPITGTGAAAPDYAISYLGGTLTVRTFSDQITVTAGSASRTYNGLPLTSNTYTVDNLPANHTIEVVVSGSATRVADSVPGNNVVSSVVIKNSADQDVTASFPNVVRVPGTLSITPAPLTVVMDVMHIDMGSPAPLYRASYLGFVNGETESVLIQTEEASCPYILGAPIGAYVINGSGVVAANYAITYIPGALIVDTYDNQVTLEAGSLTKEYDGAPLTDAKVLSSGLPGGYTVEAVTQGTVTAVGAPVKNTVTSYKIFNSQHQDVTVGFSNVALVQGKLEVMPREILIIADSPGKTKGEADPVLTARVEGAVEGDVINYTLQRQSGEEPGAYPIEVVPGSNPNYLVSTVPGLFTIQDLVAPAQHTIQATAGDNGSITPSGLVSVTDGAAQSFTFQANSGYYVSSLVVDGKVQAFSGNSYTFDKVEGNHTLHVLFSKNEEPAPAPAPAAAENSGIPKTQDTSQLLLWTLLALLSLLGLGVLTGLRIRAGKKASHEK